MAPISCAVDPEDAEGSCLQGYGKADLWEPEEEGENDLAATVLVVPRSTKQMYLVFELIPLLIMMMIMIILLMMRRMIMMMIIIIIITYLLNVNNASP